LRSEVVSFSVPAIEVDRLEREYKGGLKAVDGIDLSVEAGEVYGFLGPNGAGKTTTVRMLVTLLRPTGGHARVAGHDVAKEPHAVRARIGVALQEAALDLLMTGKELMELQATLHGIRAASVRGGRRTSSSASASPRPRTAAWPPTRAACAGAWTSRWRSSTRPTSSSSTSRRPAWTRSAASPCGTRSAASRRGHHGLPDHAVPRGGRPARRPRGIISSGKIVAEGTPASLKAEVGVPAPRHRAGRGDGRLHGLDRAREVVSQFGDHRPAAEGCHLSIAVAGGARDVAPVVRALDDAGFVVASLDLQQPTLDDVFVEKTGRHLEGAADAAPAGDAAPEAAPGVIRSSMALARRAMRNSLRRPQFLAPLLIFPACSWR
jgi:ABC-2 type transport system ATP-binding protein